MPDAIASGIDHVNAGVRDVRAVAGVLTDDLGLGVAFGYREYPEWVTAGVSVGDATLAIDSSESVWFLTPTTPARWRSVSLRPALAPPALAAALDQRGIANSGPSPYAIDSEEQWINVFATGVLPPDEMAFFTRYSSAVGQQIERAHAAFLDAGGGPLGVTGLAEVAIGGQAEPWARMLAPVTRRARSRADQAALGRIGEGTTLGLRIQERSTVEKRADPAFIGEIVVRSDDSAEAKTFELRADQFKINDATGEVDFADDSVRQDIVDHVTTAVLLVAHREVSAADD